MLKSPNAGSSQRQLVQVLIVSAVAILLVGGALIGLLNTQVVRLQSKADSKQAEVGSSQQVARRYDLTLSSYNDTMSRIEFLETSVTPASYVPTLLKQLQDLAQKTHLQVLTIRPSQITSPAPPAAPPPVDASGPTATGAPTTPAKKKAPPPYDTMDVSLDISGTYQATAAFLYNLTRFPKIIAVAGAQLHPAPAGPGENPLASPTVQTSLHLTAFVFHDDATAANVTGAAPGTGSPVPPSSGGVSPMGVPPPSGIPASPPVTTSTGFSGAAQRAVSGATGASAAARARNEVGVGTL